MRMMIMMLVMPVGQLLAFALPTILSLARRLRVLAFAVTTAFDIAVGRRTRSALTRTAAATAPTATASTSTTTCLAIALAALTLALTATILTFRSHTTRKWRSRIYAISNVIRHAVLIHTPVGFIGRDL